MMSSQSPLVSPHWRPRHQFTGSRAAGRGGGGMAQAAGQACRRGQLGRDHCPIEPGQKPRHERARQNCGKGAGCAALRRSNGRGMQPMPRLSKNGQRRRSVSCEGESEQARAKQRQASRSQSQEAVGDKVMIAHETPSEVDARLNRLKLSERAFFMVVKFMVAKRNQKRGLGPQAQRTPSNA